MMVDLDLGSWVRSDLRRSRLSWNDATSVLYLHHPNGDNEVLCCVQLVADVRALVAGLDPWLDCSLEELRRRCARA